MLQDGKDSLQLIQGDSNSWACSPKLMPTLPMWGMRENDVLALVGGVRQDFLVACQRGVEDRLCYGCALCTEGPAFPY